MKKKLILATNSFPYDTGEQAFILPELRRLQEAYDITVISHADAEQMKRGYVAEEFLKGLRILCFPRPVLTALDKLVALLSYLFSADGRQEIREIVRTKRHVAERFYQSLSFYAQALADQKEIKVSRLLSESEPVVYYSFWNTYYCYSMIREKKKHPNIRIISRLHGFDLYHERIPGGRQPLKHQMEAGSDSLIFLGAYARAYYQEQVQGQAPGVPMYVCPLGIEAPGRRMPWGQEEEWQLLSCSALIPLKRVERIIDGLSGIETGKIHWTHIGDGSEAQKIREYAAQRLTCKENIRYSFAGKMEHWQVLQYYETNQVDCFITTSSTEGVPVSVMEAMSYSIPIIGTAVGGIPEMIRGNGILLSRDPSAQEVADALTTVCSMNEQEAGALKGRSYELWKATYDIQTIARKLMDIL
ncbi:MAG: glycosyltransferase [Lachnospiraceae bacterium]